MQQKNRRPNEYFFLQIKKLEHHFRLNYLQLKK